jgi:hypothetical protein
VKTTTSERQGSTFTDRKGADRRTADAMPAEPGKEVKTNCGTETLGR